MPAPERILRYQTALLWEFSGYDKYGQPTVSAPVEIQVRWNTKRREVVDAKGFIIAYDASAVVDQVIAVGSLMWLGTLEDWNDAGTGSGSTSISADDVFECKNFTLTPDLKNRFSQKTVDLMRYRKLPPTG